MRTVDWRLVIFALLAVALGVWAVLEVAPLATGTLLRMGPGMAPHAAAIALVVVGALVLLRAATGFAVAPARPLPSPWRLALLLPMIVLLVLPEIMAVAPGVPFLAPLTAPLSDLMLRATQVDFFALICLRWTLAVAIGVVAAGEGLLSGLAALLLGIVLGLAGVDVNTGVERLAPLDAMREQAPFAIEIAVVVAMIVLRVNPLPAALAYVGAMTAEETFRRSLLLAQGEPMQALAGHAFAQAVLAAVVLLALVMAWYRRPRRATGSGAEERLPTHGETA